MVKEHPTFNSPENEEVKVWRYIDFTKLIPLIVPDVYFSLVLICLTILLKVHIQELT
jgi:hypothetical protein